jgi:hypothetical protein
MSRSFFSENSDQFLDARGPTPHLASSFQTGVKAQMGALITIRNFLLNRYEKQFANLAIKHRLPSMPERIDYVQAGWSDVVFN